MDGVSIIGCGGHARSVADIILDNCESTNLVFYDKYAKPEEKMFAGKYAVYTLDFNTDFKYKNIFIAIGNNGARKDFVSNSLADSELKEISVISKRAYISKWSKIDKGVFIANGTHIGPEASIGSFSIINNGAVVEHEVEVGAFAHISVNATVCGKCKIGEGVFLGAGSIVKDKACICDNVIIGAGGVVISDISIPGIYVGNPVKRINEGM